MKKKFAFILMGGHYDPKFHRADFETENQITCIRTVRTFDEAFETVKTLHQDGVGAIELCGAFGKEKADEIIALTNNEIAVGFVVHNPEQDSLFERFFGN